MSVLKLITISHAMMTGMGRIVSGGRRGFTRREFLKTFLPIAATVAAAIMSAAILLSALFMRQSMRILEENEAERLRYSIRLFARIHLGSVPAFLSAMEEDPIRNYLYGRDWSIEKPLRGLERIDRAIIGNEFIDSLYLYNADAGFLSTRSGWERRKEASDPDLSVFLSRVREYGLSRYIPRRVTFAGESSPRNLFTLVLGNMPSKGAAIRYAFIANLSERAVRSALSGDESSVSVLYILDTDGRFLSHPDPTRFTASSKGDALFDAIRARPESSGTHIIRGADGKRRIVWWADHPELRWRFVSAASEDAVFAPVMRVRDTVVLLSALVLLTSIAAAFALSSRMSGRDTRVEQALAYLRGEADADELPVARLFPSLRFPVTIAILRVDDYRSLVAEHGAAALHDFREELLSVLAPLVGACDAMRLTEDTFLLLVEGDFKRALESLRAASAEAGKRISASIGGYVAYGTRGIDALPAAFRELRAAGRAEFLRSRGEMIVVEPKVTAAAIASAADFDFSRLEKAFRLDDASEAARQVDTLIAYLRAAADPDLFRYAVSTLGSRIPALLGADAEVFLPGGIEGFREAMSSTDRLEDAGRTLRAVAERLGERGFLHAERRQRELIDKVKELVDSRLSDRALGTAAIASEVGLSASYLRDLFKKSEGIALLEYVGKARLALAKRLLTDSSDPVRSVCDQAGFINYSYFFTYFKKMTGCTPSEYRDGERRQD
ncbi:MAG: AraC family transcriptional regulator [Treponemataceae bacterium]